MHAETLLTTADVTRFWHVDTGQSTHLVVLHFFPLTNTANLTVDGAELPQGQLSFELDDQSQCVMQITSSSPWLARAGLADWTFTLTREGRPLVDSIHEKVPDSFLRPSPPNVIEPVISGDRVVWYRIAWAPTSSQPAVDIHRRYRDFFMLYSQVCSDYRASHLYTSVPELPGKELFSPDQLNAEFIEQRRVGLEVWLRRLVKLPGVTGGRNPDVEEFLGVGGARGIAETSAVFAAGKLGMRLAKPIQDTGGKGSFSAQIASFLSEEDGSPGQAEKSNRLRVGDMIVRVSGESAILLEYQSVVDLLRTSPRPLVIHFLGLR